MNYIRLAIFVIIACLIGGLSFELWQARANEKTAISNAAVYKTQVDGLLTINQTQAENIARLTNQRVIDDKAVAGLNDKLDAIASKADEQTQQVEALANDPTAKPFLDLALPANVGVLFTK